MLLDLIPGCISPLTPCRGAGGEFKGKNMFFRNAGIIYWSGLAEAESAVVGAVSHEHDAGMSQPGGTVQRLPHQSRAMPCPRRSRSDGERRQQQRRNLCVSVADDGVGQHDVSEKTFLFFGDELQLRNRCAVPQPQDKILFVAVGNARSAEGFPHKGVDAVVVGRRCLSDMHRDSLQKPDGQGGVCSGRFKTVYGGRFSIRLLPAKGKRMGGHVPAFSVISR